MPTTPHCLSWCEDHDEDLDICRYMRSIYSNDESSRAQPDSAFAKLAAQMQSSGVIPDEANVLVVRADYFHEDDGLEMQIAMWDLGQDQASATLSIDLEGLREVHSNLGDVIDDLNEPGK